MSTGINNALLRLSKRAESADRSKLVETFVDTGALATLLASRDHQVIFGRRGTGKTHALLYLADTMANSGDFTVYVDLRNVGSTGGLYADQTLPITERATRLLADVLSAICEDLLRIAIDQSQIDLTLLGKSIDALGAATSTVAVRGEDDRSRVHFGAVGAALKQIMAALSPKRLWILLDEWSVIPLELQPYLADFIRRAFLPVLGVTVKLAAIEHRSRFSIPSIHGDYLGIELGADAAGDLNLDDFMVFDNDAARATAFFRDLLFRHYKSVEREAGIKHGPATPQQFVQTVFTQKTPFEDLVAAAEGVPRDAINILAMTAQRAGNDLLSIPHVRNASKVWYQRDKEANVPEKAKALLHWIVDKVIGRRKARAFLLLAGQRHRLIDTLFDARVLHLLKRGIAAHDQPGVRFDVFKIDYGCYVDLLSTQRSPQGLLPLDDGTQDGSYVDVPPDDYRSIRRAILDLDEFLKSA